MTLASINTILLRAMSDTDFRETLFADFPGAVAPYELTAEERDSLERFSREQFERMVGGLVMHEVAPVQAGRRIWVVPSWCADTLPPGSIPITLQAGVVFGNGTHATTRLCLAALEDRLRPGDRVLDLGTGTGILAIGAARLGAARVQALDIVPSAVEVACRNVAVNGVAGTVFPEVGSLDSAPLGAADLVVANLLTHIVVVLMEQGLAQRVRPGGTLIVSGIPVHHFPVVRDASRAAGLKMAEYRELEGWCAAIYKRPRRWLHKRFRLV
jgi:ribosomal protein L11 methyltransferase